MALIRIQHAAIRLGSQTEDLFQDVSFEINPGDRVGLIGPNGCGKTTLLRFITSELTPDEGNVIRSPSVDTAGYLRQKTVPDENRSALSAALSGFPEVADLKEQIASLEMQMQQPSRDDLDQVVGRYGDALDAYHRAGGYETERVAIEALLGLGLTDDEISSPMTHLSSGQRTRIGLARLIIQPTDLLLLDEPTNHLDIDGQDWLADYLDRFSGAVLIVSHDRYFLDRTVTRILELRRGKLREYTGNFSDYDAMRRQEEAAAQEQYERAGKEVKRLRAAVGERKRLARKVQGNKATAGTFADFYARKASKVMKRAKVIERKVEQQIEKQIESKPFIEKQTALSFPPVAETGNTLISASGLSKRYDDKRLFEDVNFSITRGQRVAMIGRNGTGKTTLMKILLRQLEPDAGRVRSSARVRIGYYAQEQEGLKPERTILEEALSAGNTDETWVRIVLGALLLRKEKVHDRIRDLSVGEQGRVALAKLLLSGANLLMLDEPTNHLDIDAREAVEHALINYPGAIMFISHDRRLIEHLADTIIELVDGHIRYYETAAPSTSTA